MEIYIKDQESILAAANPNLCAFQRVKLEGGEKKDLTIHIPARAFCIVDEQGKRRIDGQTFSLYAGMSQPDERSKQLTGRKSVELQIRI